MTVGELKELIGPLPDDDEIAIKSCLIGHEEHLAECARYKEIVSYPHRELGKWVLGRKGRVVLYDIPDPGKD